MLDRSLELDLEATVEAEEMKRLWDAISVPPPLWIQRLHARYCRPWMPDVAIAICVVLLILQMITR